MEWDIIYEELSNEKVDNVRVTGNQIINKIKKINESNRAMFLEYHKHNMLRITDGISLEDYKLRRRYIIDFLVDESINSICLAEATQEQLLDYFLKYINRISKFSLDDRIKCVQSFFNRFKNMPGYLNIRESIKKHKINLAVPDWPGYFPDLRKASNKQNKFYDYWLKNYKQNIFIDINGVLAYPYIYIYSIIDEFSEDKDINKLVQEFTKIQKAYGHYTNISLNLSHYLTDAYFFIGDYDSSWRCIVERVKKRRETYFRGSITFEELLEVKTKCKNTAIIGEEFLLIVGNTKSLTELGRQHLKEISLIAEILLDDFEKEHGANLIEYFINHFDYWNLSEKDFKTLKQYIDIQNEERFDALKNSHLARSRIKNRDLMKYTHLVNDPETFFEIDRHFFETEEVYYKYLQEAVEDAKNQIQLIINAQKPKRIFCKNIGYCKDIPQIISEALQGKLMQIMRECEDTFREENSIPKIGEGWMCETHLYHFLRNYFKDQVIVHHGRPKWLGRQHLDIFFPEKNIAIEYQGLQHSQPVEYFGGITAFNEQQKRDRRKQKLCEKNHCTLIYVYPNYDINEIIKCLNILL